jgi:hypothetical protein
LQRQISRSSVSSVHENPICGSEGRRISAKEFLVLVKHHIGKRRILGTVLIAKAAVVTSSQELAEPKKRWSKNPKSLGKLDVKEAAVRESRKSLRNGD